MQPSVLAPLGHAILRDVCQYLGTRYVPCFRFCPAAADGDLQPSIAPAHLQPGLSCPTQALVERYTEVEVNALSPDGTPVRLRASGWKSRILQHEVDHLRGTLYVDRMLSRSFSARGQSILPSDVPPQGPCSCSHPINVAA